VRRSSFWFWVAAIAALATAQSGAHLATALGAGRIGTIFDLDRSNGLPDIASTLALAAGSAAAVALGGKERGPQRMVSLVAAVLLSALTLADLLHDGAHPWGRTGPIVITTVLTTLVLTAVIAVRASRRTRAVLLFATLCLAASFVISGLDRFDQWFERRRGDAVAEYRIVAKESLELVGWSLIALGLWDEARRRQRMLVSPRAPASRARAASRPRGA
jgi:Ca2+/Na+ antiporter